MSDGDTPPTTATRVVVVGSSSGGLEALTSLLGAFPPDLGWCLVIAQHLSPTDFSQLVPLLARKTALQVVQATDGAAFQPNSVLVAPSGNDIVVNRTTVSLVQPDEAHRPWPSINRLFVSAAEAFGADAVGVVLSGAGDDGTDGVRAISAAGGVVVVQDQESAAFGSMPGAAFATGTADLRLPPQDIPAALERIFSMDTEDAIADQPGAARPRAGSWALDDAAVETAIVTLHASIGVDYSGYKRSTLRRQIERRMRIVNQMPADYVAALADDTAEATALSHSILVGVTAFFRDAPVWEALIPLLEGLVQNLEPMAPMRVWVPGCASGEEAYTIAMLAAEALGPHHGNLSARLKIFATDLDERALVTTRAGRYSNDAVAAIPAPLRDRWLNPVGDEWWEVVPRLRECLVVAAHNVAFDPPFPRLHLISLRNTMIYFQSQLQERVLQLCQFALLPDALLVLGKSEQVPRLDALFSVAAPGHRIYRRRDLIERVPLPSGRYLPATPIPTPEAVAARRYHGPALYRRLLRILAAPSLVLDDDDTLIEVIGDVSPWCVVGEGRHSGHVTDLLRESYRLVVRMMLSEVRQSGDDGAARRVVVGPDGPVEVSVTRVMADGVGAVVGFRIPASPPDASDAPMLIDPEGPQMSAALETAQEALQATIEDLSNSNEELQALNEELQASAEELQATSEEAQASNEELETANEELTTLNHELQARGVELVNANTDLENIQASMTSGLIMVDRELRILRYSPLAVRVFSLIHEDIGRPLPAVPTTIPVPTLVADLQETIATRSSRLIELNDATRDILLQLQPYTGSSGEALGALVVVIDVSDVAQARREREAALDNLETVAESVREIVWQRDDSGVLTYLTKRVEDVYGMNRDQVLADPGLLTAAIHPEDRDRVAAVMASTERRWQLEYRIVRPDGSVRWVDESAIRTTGTPPAAPSITGSALDVTDRHRLQAAAAARGAVLDALMHTNTVGVLVLDSSDRVLQASEPVASIIGYRPEALVGTPLNVLLEHDPAARLLPASPLRRELDARRILGPDGIYRAVTTELLPISVEDGDNSDGTPARVAIVHDVTRLREISADLAAREQFDQQTGLLTRTYFHSRTDELVAGGNKALAVLWIDLDGFKEINDRFGHRSGDVVLSTIASRLQRAARRHDAIGRLGGDEFAVLVTRAKDLDGLETLVHRILNAVREPIDVAGTMAYVSASVGIAVYPQDGHTAEELLHNADTAMYAAKQRGRDRHAYFATEMDNRADERAELRRELAQAVRHKDFELHYQPVLDTATGRLAHVEALLRWRRGDELVTADAFISHATETGQLRAIGRLVLQLLDRDMHAMQDRLGDRQPHVAVNLSATELEERDTSEWLLTWDPAGGFDRVIVEITESVLVRQERAVDTLAALHRLGATISVDDFGTGYSNLEALDRLQPGIIKVERTLLERANSAGADSRAGKILAASVQLAHALNAEVVVEGVADNQMWSQVKTLGAEMAQGYFLAQPMPLPALVDWITADGE